MRKFNLLPHFVLFVVLSLAVVSLAACGGGDEPAPTATPAPAAAAPAQDSAAAQPAALAGDSANGQKVYSLLCIACHGPEGKGVQGLGKDLTTSTFVAEKTDAELVEFVKAGRGPEDPLNTTGVAMPPKGGNPALSDAQILDIIAYIRSIRE